MKDNQRAPDKSKTAEPSPEKPVTTLPPAESPRVVKKYQIERSMLSGYDSDRW